MGGCGDYSRIITPKGQKSKAHPCIHSPPPPPTVGHNSQFHMSFTILSHVFCPPDATPGQWNPWGTSNTMETICKGGVVQ